MAGLLAGRVLADHFEQVVLLERDAFPSAGTHRKGVPQSRHTHVLLERGRQAMEALLPGLTDELARRGAARIPDAGLHVRWFHSGAFHRPGAAGVPGIGVSRLTLEETVRRRVLALPNVQAHEGCGATGLTASPDGRRVTGVRVTDRQGSSRERTLPTDLVVDAGGRGSRGPAWLGALGYPRPAAEEVRIGMGYTTCFYRREPAHLPGLEGLVVLATPPDRRLAVLLAQDGGRWVCTIGGYLGDHAPAAHDGFLEAARELPTSRVYDVIRDATPLTEPATYTFPANRRHRYDRLTRFPEGYLVLGDALCSFNPIYGQGMTVAALEAQALGACLDAGGTDLAPRFFAKARPVVDVAWSTAVGSDLSYAGVEGRRTPMTRVLSAYMRRLHRAAHRDARVSAAFLEVINMSTPPASLLHPLVVGRVLAGNVAARLRPRRPAATLRPASRSAAPPESAPRC